ncbi:hypothetical protein [Spongiimicrobium sp. 3-5]|uniref:hypothetical protein n=1 Tax=Spongiimicrobium sp. 3-5 TaxID=3332596 RepID=UPI00397FE5AA
MRFLSILGLSLLLLSCKETPKKVDTDMNQSTKEVEAVKNDYPEALQQVFDAHGGLASWKAKRSLVYEMPDPENTEIHTTDLYSRKDRIDSPGFSLGFDGEDVWLLDPDDNYKGDPVFYHNLMFYFYAMPFLLADDGIVYSATPALDFEGMQYPGIRISYNAGVGTSYKDEYFIHYHPETNQMAWLGYTVTYRSGEKSDNVKWIRYNDWMEVGDVILPKSITWHAYEGRNIKEAKSTVQFENVSLDETPKPAAFFAKPDASKVVVGKVQ